MHSNPAPGGDEFSTIATAPPDSADDPVRRLLGVPADPVRRLGRRHWLGMLGLVAAIAVAAFVMPPLITPADAPAAGSTAAPPRTASSSPASPATAPSGPAATAPAGPGQTSTTPGTGPVVPGETTRAGSARTATKRPAPGGTAASPSPASDVSENKFTTMVMQAEDGSLSGGATVADCDTCVAGARVRYVGRVDVRATIPSAGTYDVTVVYEVDGKRRLDVSINGEPPIAARTVTGSNWTTPQMLTVRTTLPAGSIDIGLYGDDGNGPDLDAVTIS